MNMAGKMLLLIVIVDTFLFFGMGAVGQSGGYGSNIGHFINVTNESVNNDYVQNNLINTNQSSFIPATSDSSNSYSITLNSILGFVELIFSIASAPFNFLSSMGAPLFVKVLVGGAYMIMSLVAVIQLISGRAA